MKISFFEKFYFWKYHCDINEELDSIESLSSYDAKSFAKWQEQSKWEIAHFHYNNNSFYRSIVGETFPSTWEELPIMTRNRYQENMDLVITDSYKHHDLYTNTTSGSTGQPLRFSKDYKTQARVWAAKKRFFNLHGISIGSKEARFYAVSKEYKSFWIDKVKDMFLNRVRFDVFSMSQSTFSDWLEVFRQNKFEYAYGFTSAIVLFSRYLIKNDIVIKDICNTLKVCIVTSEVCTEDDKNVIQKAFGVKVLIEYGSKDVGLIGYECLEGKLHIPEENIYVELNENNEVIVTDLSNKSFPFVRYFLGDRLMLSDKECACKSHNRVIDVLDGRSGEIIKLPGDRTVSGIVFIIIMRSTLENLGNLEEFVIHQNALDKFTVEIVSDKKLSKVDCKKLEKVAEGYLGKHIQLEINQVDKIDRESSGKLKYFYSDI